LPYPSAPKGVLSDLYAISGQATALMASSAFDLNRWSESEALARSAISYAAMAGHSSLQAWTHGPAALLANWRREPDIALSVHAAWRRRWRGRLRRAWTRLPLTRDLAPARTTQQTRITAGPLHYGLPLNWPVCCQVSRFSADHCLSGNAVRGWEPLAVILLRPRQ
jgi:hypothetical protein